MTLNDGSVNNDENLIPQDSSQLSQGFKVGNVDDERAQAVIEDKAETLQELSQSWAALFFILQATKQFNMLPISSTTFNIFSEPT